MKTKLSKAVLQLFHEEFRGHFPAFSRQEWERHYFWLDASGMALYLLDRLRSHDLQSVLPESVRRRLEQNHTDNTARMLDLFGELTRINSRFTALNLRYANLKGFTLMPYAFTDPTLRFQCDLDLLVDQRDATAAGDILRDLGYVLTGAGSTVWEFKENAGALPSAGEMYKIKPQRSVELHFLAAQEGGSSPGGALLPLQMLQWNGVTYPALAEPEKFVALAQHLFRHLRSEWTRLSWLLEFKQFVCAKRDDATFWQSVRTCAAAMPQATIAIGASLYMVTAAFGNFVPADLRVWAMDPLPPSVAFWIECYGETVALADFPGTKLYLLLDAALAEHAPAEFMAASRRKKLLPMYLAPRIVYGTAKDTLRLRAGRALVQLRYNGFRMRFHIVQGARYLLEAHRWKRHAALQQS